jgi:hypothetical protein
LLISIESSARNDFRLKALKKDVYELKKTPKWQILHEMASQKDKTALTKNIEEERKKSRRV